MNYENAIIIDSNCYFRLAKSIHPLLNNPFGKKKYHLYILKNLQIEYKKSSRLKNKFIWFYEREFISDRNNNIFPEDESNNNAVHEHTKWVREEARSNYYIVSEIDINHIAIAITYENTLVTDDSDMMRLAKEFDVKVIKTLDLVKLMRDNNFINNKKVKEIIEFWNYIEDEPGSFEEDFKNIFGISVKDFKKKY